MAQLFNDDELKLVIKEYFENPEQEVAPVMLNGIDPNQVPSDLLNQPQNNPTMIAVDMLENMVQEIKQKLSDMGQATPEALKKCLEEMKMGLQPTASVDEDRILTANNELMSHLKSLSYLVSTAAIQPRNPLGGEIESIRAELASNAAMTGQKIQKYIISIGQEQKSLSAKVAETNGTLKEISNFDENDTTMQQQILDLVADPKFQEMSNMEHAALPFGPDKNGNIVKKYKLKDNSTSEAQRVKYSPEQITELNRVFWNSESPEVKSWQVGTTAKGDAQSAILWSRKRFAFERAIGNEDKPLYQARYADYAGYVSLNKALVVALRREYNLLERLRTVAIKKKSAKEFLASISREHFHTLPARESVDYLDNKIAEFHGSMEMLKQNLSEDIAAERANKVEIDKINAEISALLSKQSFSPVHIKGEQRAFDPNYIYGLGRKDRGKFEAGDQYQTAKLPANTWSVASDGKPYGEPLEGENVTWRLGHTLYNKFDKAEDKTMLDANTILTYSQNQLPRITQAFTMSPYFKDSKQLQQWANQLKKLEMKGWKDARKGRVAGENANWAILFNLAKKSVSKASAIEQLFSENGLQISEELTLNDGSKKPMSEIFRQLPEVNPMEVRNDVVMNSNTPDWVLMYVAQHEGQGETVQTNAIQQLAQPSRGWIPKKDNKGNPIADPKTGDWIWVKGTKKASMSLSYREAAGIPQTIKDPLDLINTTQTQIQNLEKENARQQNDYKQKMDGLQKQIAPATVEVGNKVRLIGDVATPLVGPQPAKTQGAPANTTAVPGAKTSGPAPAYTGSLKKNVKFSRRG